MRQQFFLCPGPALRESPFRFYTNRGTPIGYSTLNPIGNQIRLPRNGSDPEHLTLEGTNGNGFHPVVWSIRARVVNRRTAEFSYGTISSGCYDSMLCDWIIGSKTVWCREEGLSKRHALVRQGAEGGEGVTGNRRSIRLRGYDYSQAGSYFVTICAQNRECLFGEIVGAATGGRPEMVRSGRIFLTSWRPPDKLRQLIEGNFLW